MNEQKKIQFGQCLAECLGERFAIPKTVHPWAVRFAYSVVGDSYIAGIAPKYVDCPYSPDEGEIPDWIIVRGVYTKNGHFVEVAFPTATYNEIDMEDWEQFSMLYIELAVKHREFNSIGGDSDEN